ncbi:MAG: MFS transporter [Candidatus Thorarchaeota archaeon]
MNKNILILLICNSLFAITRSLTRGNLPEYVIILGGTLVSWGFIATIGIISNIIAIIPSNFLSDILGRKYVIIMVAFFGFIGSIFTAFAPTWEWLIIGYVSLELQQGVFIPSAIAYISDEIPDEDDSKGKRNNRIKFFTYFELSGVFGGSVGYLISSFYFIFVGDVYTENLLRGNMIIAIFLAFLSFIAILFISPTKKDLRTKNNMNLKEKIVKPTHREMFIVFGFTLSSFFIGLGAGFFLPFAQPFWYNVFNLSPATINIILGASFVCVSLGMFLIPYLTTRMSKTKVILLTQGFAIPLILVIAWSPLLIVVLPAYLGRFTLMNMARPVQNTLLQRGLTDNYRATGQSISTLADRIGRGITPAFASIIILELGFSVSFTITAIFYILAIVILFITIKLFKLEEPYYNLTKN